MNKKDLMKRACPKDFEKLEKRDEKFSPYSFGKQACRFAGFGPILERAL